MATVERFSRSMIKRYLDANGLRYMVDHEGDFFIQFAYEDEVGGNFTVYLMAAGDSQQIYYMRADSTRHIQRDDWGRAITLCNTWNKEKRWPKVYLNVRNPAVDRTGTIVCEEQLDLEKGIHQEGLANMTDMFMAAANMFWRWAHGEHGL